MGRDQADGNGGVATPNGQVSSVRRSSHRTTDEPPYKGSKGENCSRSWIFLRVFDRVVGGSGARNWRHGDFTRNPSGEAEARPRFYRKGRPARIRRFQVG